MMHSACILRTVKLLFADFRKEHGVDAIVKLMATAVCALVLSACGGNALTAQDGKSDGVASGHSQVSYSVMVSAGAGGTISPSGAVLVNLEATRSFEVTPNAGYSISSIGGTCGGTLSGNTYTIKPITADCTIVATFSQIATSASIAACFTVPKTVNFRLVSYSTASSAPALPIPTQRSVEPTSFNGQAATRSITTSSPVDIRTSFGDSNYWAVTSNGIFMFGHMYSDSTAHISALPAIISLSMQPGEFVDLASAAVITPIFNRPAHYIFIGFEAVTLAGKTFQNVCHFQLRDTSVDAIQIVDHWYAPGYGEIQSAFPSYRTGTVSGYRYAGNL